MQYLFPLNFLNSSPDHINMKYLRDFIHVEIRDDIFFENFYNYFALKYFFNGNNFKFLPFSYNFLTLGWELSVLLLIMMRSFLRTFMTTFKSLKTFKWTVTKEIQQCYNWKFYSSLKNSCILKRIYMFLRFFFSFLFT